MYLLILAVQYDTKVFVHLYFYTNYPYLLSPDPLFFWGGGDTLCSTTPLFYSLAFSTLVVAVVAQC